MHHAQIDSLAHRDSCVHRLDARVKLLVTLLFTVVVLSLPRLAVSPALCFMVGPFALLVLAGISLRSVTRRTLLACPFILVVGLACPYYERAPLQVHFGPFTWETTAGWIRCWAIFAKYLVCMLALLCLASTTRFPDLLIALRRLRTPQVFVTQLGFLYRHLFIMMDQVQRIKRARQTRSLGFLGMRREVSVAGSMLGALLFRCLDRSERVGLAMHARGFSGRWTSTPGSRLAKADRWFCGLSLLFLGGLYFLISWTML